MDREVSNNLVEKQRLRSAIEDQVRQYLAQGGSITVLQPPTGGSAKASHGGLWPGAAYDGNDVMAALD